MPVRSLLLASLLTLLPVVPACNGAGEAPTSDALPDGAGGTELPPADEASEGGGHELPGPESLAGLDLSGTWARLDVRSALATVPLAGQVTRVTTSLFLAELAHEGERLGVTLRLCALTADSGTDLVQTIFPDALVASIAPQSFEATLVEEGGRVRYLEPRHVDVRGCHLDDPEQEALPEAPDDPRVYDQDGDGRPGLTVRVVGVVNGEVYVVQRLGTAGQGVVSSPDALEGLVAWTDEQRHLGTDNPLLAEPNPSSPDPEPAHSYFRMVRLAPGSDCADVAGVSTR